MDYLKYWMIGTVSAWTALGLGYLYLKAGGPLPNTDKYIREKYERQAALLEVRLTSHLRSCLMK